MKKTLALLILLLASTASAQGVIDSLPKAATGFINLKLLTVTVDNITTTSTDGIVSQNTTAATVGVTVQQSPRIKLCGAAWNSVGAASQTDCFSIETLPATNAGTTTANLKFRSSIAGGAFADALTVSDTGAFVLPATGTWSTVGREFMRSTANGLLQIGQNSASTPQIEMNTGTAQPTLTACGTGTVDTKSTNFAGKITPTGASACTVTFGAPAFTNTPYCIVTFETTAEAFRISAKSTTAFTVTFTTAANVFDYICLGGL